MTAAGDTRISIVIPHLNQLEFLERCLNSLAAQIARYDVEVIVVDNGSHQLPHDVCSRHAFVKLEQETTPGPGPARNRGIAAASGDILAFIDADCIAHRDWLHNLVQVFTDDACTAIVGGDVRIDPANPGRITMLEAYEIVFAFRQQHYIEKLGFSGTGNLAMRREAYDAVGPFGGIEIAEDRDWGRRATQRGYRIRYVPEMIIFHPARRTFDELRRKCDRHVSHDYQDSAGRAFWRLRWGGLALAVAVSGIADIRKVIASKRISTARDRFLAAAILIAIRVYRAWRMSSILLLGSNKAVRYWNRI
jgi:GT2 family glycosyltransferase